jgi:hypothetical protein
MTSPIPTSREIASKAPIKGAGGLACLAFAAVLGCAFWLGALLASHPLIH